MLDRKKNLYLKDTVKKGRGVFCTTAIKKGEYLEVTPAIVFNEQAGNHIDKTVLENYVFMVGDISQKLRDKYKIKKGTDATCVVMGIASFCNDATKPNAEILWQEDDTTLYYILHATHDIPKDTEICTTYGERWFEDR